MGGNILISLTVHESYESINNFIEILNITNKNNYLIIHVNKSWTDFDFKNINNTNNNVFINENRFYLKNKYSGKSGIHISNLEYANSINLDYEFVILSTSNQFFTKPVDFKYLIEKKYGSDFLCIESKFEEYEKISHHDKDFIKSQFSNYNKEMSEIGKNNGVFGGPHEGIFFTKEISIKIIETYRKYFNNNINLFRCDEEVIIHTILYNIVKPTETESLCFFMYRGESIENFKKFIDQKMSEEYKQKYKTYFTKNINKSILKKISIKPINRVDINLQKELIDYVK